MVDGKIDAVELQSKKTPPSRTSLLQEMGRLTFSDCSHLQFCGDSRLVDIPGSCGCSGSFSLTVSYEKAMTLSLM